MKRYSKGFDYGLGEGVIRNKCDCPDPISLNPKSKFKKGDILLEACGCRWEVLRVNKKSYTLQYLTDKTNWNWEKEDCENHLSKSVLTFLAKLGLRKASEHKNNA